MDKQNEIKFLERESLMECKIDKPKSFFLNSIFEVMENSKMVPFGNLGTA